MDIYQLLKVFVGMKYYSQKVGIPIVSKFGVFKFPLFKSLVTRRPKSIEFINIFIQR